MKCCTRVCLTVVLVGYSLLSVPSFSSAQQSIQLKLLQYRPRTWTLSGSLIVAKLFAEALSNTWRLDLIREGLSVMAAEKRSALMPATSPRHVLVVGTDPKPAKSSSANLRIPMPLSRE